MMMSTLTKCSNIHNDHNDHMDAIFAIVHVNRSVLMYFRINCSDEAHNCSHSHEDHTFIHQRSHSSTCNSSYFQENWDGFILESKVGATMKSWMTQTCKVGLGYP